VPDVITDAKLRVPNLDDSADGPDGFTELAEDVAALVVGQGLLAARPTSSGGTPGIKGRLFEVRGDSAGVNGLYRDYGTGWSGPYQTPAAVPAVTFTYTETIGFAVHGTVGVISAGPPRANYILPICIEGVTGEVITLTKLHHQLLTGASGVSASFKLQRSTDQGATWSDITGFGTTGSPLIAGGAVSNPTQLKTVDPTDVLLNAGDMLLLVVTAVTGSPEDLIVQPVITRTRTTAP
jgi:hypothetical protein